MVQSVVPVNLGGMLVGSSLAFQMPATAAASARKQHIIFRREKETQTKRPSPAVRSSLKNIEQKDGHRGNRTPVPTDAF